ncbi:hypothetical protein BDK51DRAFT_26093, partial [Blyttiomyces helicus]
TGDEFYANYQWDYDNRWRNLGYLACFWVFNIFLAVGLIFKKMQIYFTHTSSSGPVVCFLCDWFLEDGRRSAYDLGGGLGGGGGGKGAFSSEYCEKAREGGNDVRLPRPRTPKDALECPPLLPQHVKLRFSPNPPGITAPPAATTFTRINPPPRKSAHRRNTPSQMRPVCVGAVNSHGLLCCEPVGTWGMI